MINALKDPVPIPVGEDGAFDLARQKELADSYRQIHHIKQQLICKVQELLEIRVLPE